MIKPSSKIKRIKQFPARRNVSLWIKIVRKHFSPYVNRWLDKKRHHIHANIIPDMFLKIGNCKDRAELEKIIGEPIFALEGGEGFNETLPDGEVIIPDVVEIYIQNGYRIDVWFLNEKIHAMTGCEDFYPWE